MSHRCRDRRYERGFTLIEMTVSLAILVVVLVLSMSLLFTMKNFAARQRQFAEPRQNARRAMDYVSSYVRAATDSNFEANNPNALVCWYRSNNVPVQATYNNVQDVTLAEPDTDIITFGHGVAGARIRITKWNGPDFATSSSIWVHFRDGCPNDITNMALFMQATTCQGDCGGAFPCPGCASGVLTVIDSYGNWAYMEITGYMQSDCGDGNEQEIHLNANPGQSDVNPPGNRGVSCNTPTDCAIGKGLRFVSFRIMRDPNNPDIPQLQQKNGLFNPTTDNPGVDFFPLLDNVEDLQLAYIYNDGTIWNDGANQLLTPGGIPTQADLAPGTAVPPTDVTNIVGVRISVTSIANTPVSFMEKAKFFRPESEDRAAQWVVGDPPENRDRFYHYRLTSTVMIRNRNLGG